MVFVCDICVKQRMSKLQVHESCISFTFQYWKMHFCRFIYIRIYYKKIEFFPIGTLFDLFYDWFANIGNIWIKKFEYGVFLISKLMRFNETQKLWKSLCKELNNLLKKSIRSTNTVGRAFCSVSLEKIVRFKVIEIKNMLQ